MRIDPDDIGEAIARSLDDADGELGSIMTDVAEGWAAASRREIQDSDYDIDFIADEIEVGDPEWNGTFSKPRRGEAQIPISFDHPLSSIFEHGTGEHMITPTDADRLRIDAGDWENPPAEVFRKYGVGPYYFQSVEVSGIDALRYVETGRVEAETLLNRQT